MKREIQAGMRDSLYRSGEKIREAKRAKKDWRNTWFLQGVTVSTISCTVTPGSELKKRLNTWVNSEKYSRTKIIEDGGMPVHCGSRVKDPLRCGGCIFGDSNCMVRADQQCDRSGVIYKIQCLTCLETQPPEVSIRYIGMTRNSVHNRILYHLKIQR